jgi:hypothetical protein
VIPGEPLMTLPESAMRHAQRAQQDAPIQDPPLAWLPKPPDKKPDLLSTWWPHCAKCQKRVDWLSWTATPESSSLRVQIRCHGATEHAIVPRAAALRGEIPSLAAFTSPTEVAGDG